MWFVMMIQLIFFFSLTKHNSEKQQEATFPSFLAFAVKGFCKKSKEYALCNPEQIDKCSSSSTVGYFLFHLCTERHVKQSKARCAVTARIPIWLSSTFQEPSTCQFTDTFFIVLSVSPPPHTHRHRCSDLYKNLVTRRLRSEADLCFFCTSLFLCARLRVISVRANFICVPR